MVAAGHAKDNLSEPETDEDSDNDEKDRQDADENEGDEPQVPAIKDQKDKAPPKAWFNRDERIIEAVNSHKTWHTETKAGLRDLVKAMTNALAKVTAEISADVSNEAKLTKNRLTAVKLILGNTDDQSQTQQASTWIASHYFLRSCFTECFTYVSFFLIALYLKSTLTFDERMCH